MFLRMIGFFRLRGKVLFLNNTVLHAIFYQRCLIATDILKKLLSTATISKIKERKHD